MALHASSNSAECEFMLNRTKSETMRNEHNLGEEHFEEARLGTLSIASARIASILGAQLTIFKFIHGVLSH